MFISKENLEEKVEFDYIISVFHISSYQISAAVSQCLAYFPLFVLDYILSPDRLPLSHIMRDRDLNFQAVLAQMGVSAWVQMTAFSPAEMNQTRKVDTPEFARAPPKPDWCELALPSANSGRPSAVSGLALCVQASCLFRFGLEMNLACPLSLRTVCSDQGRALYEIEVGSWQYPSLFVFLSV